MPPHGPPSAAHRVQTTCSIILAFLLLVLGSGGYGRPDNKHPNHLKAQVHTGRHGRWARDSPDSEAPEKPVPPVALSDLPAPGAGNISWAYRHVSWTVEEFPNPWTEPARCGARQPSFICDPNRMLSPQEVRRLNGAIGRICKETPCHCTNCSRSCPGFKVAIALVPGVSHSMVFTETGSRDDELARQMALWAASLHTKSWAFGECGDDVVLVLSAEDQKVALSAGESARGRLTQTCADSVLHDAGYKLRTQQFGEALTQILRDINFVFHNDFKCEISFIQVMPTGQVIGIIFASVGPVILVVVILVFLGPCFRGRGFGGSKHHSFPGQRGRGYSDAMVMDGPMRSSARGQDVDLASSLNSTGF